MNGHTNPPQGPNATLRFGADACCSPFQLFVPEAVRDALNREELLTLAVIEAEYARGVADVHAATYIRLHQFVEAAKKRSDAEHGRAPLLP